VLLEGALHLTEHRWWGGAVRRDYLAMVVVEEAVNVDRDAGVEIWHMKGHSVDLAKARPRHRHTLVDCAHPTLSINRCPEAWPGYGARQ
jgi:hypothetical protein